MKRKFENWAAGNAPDTKVTTTTVNLRKAPNGEVIDIVRKGSSVKVLEKVKDWTKVVSNGKEGFINSKYLR